MDPATNTQATQPGRLQVHIINFKESEADRPACFATWTTSECSGLNLPKNTHTATIGSYFPQTLATGA